MAHHGNARPADQEVILRVLLMPFLLTREPLREKQQQDAINDMDRVIASLQMHICSLLYFCLFRAGFSTKQPT